MNAVIALAMLLVGFGLLILADLGMVPRGFATGFVFGVALVIVGIGLRYELRMRRAQKRATRRRGYLHD